MERMRGSLIQPTGNADEAGESYALYIAQIQRVISEVAFPEQIQVFKLFLADKCLHFWVNIAIFFMKLEEELPPLFCGQITHLKSVKDEYRPSACKKAINNSHMGKL